MEDWDRVVVLLICVWGLCCEQKWDGDLEGLKDDKYIKYY